MKFKNVVLVLISASALFWCGGCLINKSEKVPKYKSEMEYKRRIAAQNLYDKSLSMDIRMNALNFFVYPESLSFFACDDELSEELRLRAFAKMDDKTAERTLETINDQVMLASIINDRRLYYLHPIAIKRLEKFIVKKEEQIPVPVPVRDPRTVKLIKAHCEAVRKMTDQKQLAAVAEDKKSYVEIRVAAVEKLENQTLLAELAKNGDEPGVRRAAEMRLKQFDKRP